MMKKDKDIELLIAKTSDLCERARRQNKAQYTKFLNPDEQSRVLSGIGKPHGLKYELFGGTERAERKILAVLPEYDEAEDLAQYPIRAVLAEGSGYRTFTHRDFLGSILALGITRELVGDIFLSEDHHSAVLVVHESIYDFILNEFQAVATDKINCRPIPLQEIAGAENEYDVLRDTLSSLRLDALVSAAVNVSRGDAEDLISTGRVQLNHKETLQKDKAVAEKDLLSIRGKGRFLLYEVGSVNKKGRTGVIIHRYR